MEVNMLHKPVLDVKELHKIYGKINQYQYHALDNVSFQVEEGEFVGIMGPSGAGKTTLLNVISTLDKASEGSIEIAGTNITSMKQNQLAEFRSEQLGFIFQDFNLLENLTVYENIVLPLSLQGVLSKNIKPAVTEVS